MAVKSLEVLFLGSSYVDEHRLNPGVAPGTMIESECLSFIIRSDEGIFLVDAGYHPDDAAEDAKKTGANTVIRPEDYLPARLNSIGLSIDQIDKVIMTHLDHDHVGFLNDFKCEVIVQKSEMEHAQNPPEGDRFRTKASRFSSPNLKWRLLDGDTVLFPGLGVTVMPGHTPGSQCIILNLPKTGHVLLAGDIIHSMKELETEKVTMGTDIPLACESVKRLKVLSQMFGAMILPTHDDGVWKQMLKPPEKYT